MQAFKQAIERTRPLADTPPTAPPIAGSPLAKPPGGSAPRGNARSGILPESLIPEELTLLSDFAQHAPAVTAQPQSAPSTLNPELRQSLLRMQAEGIELPASLRELLEQSGEPAKPVGEQKGLKPRSSVDELAERAVSSDESAQGTDVASETRRLEIKAAYRDDGTRSKSESDAGIKSETSDAADSGKDIAPPMQTRMNIPPPTPGVQPQRLPPAAPLVQQLVEFATFGRNEAGFLEFRLGLVEDALGGLRIQLASYGNRRVGLKVKGNGGKASGIGDAELAGLIDALRAKNVEVIDVVRE